MQAARCVIASIGFIFACVGVSFAQNGAARVEFAAPAMSAEQAIKKLAAKTNRAVLFRTDNVAEVKANAVNGYFSTQEALDALLIETPLRGALTESGAITIVLREPQGVPGGNGEMKKSRFFLSTVLSGAAATFASALGSNAALAQDEARASTLLDSINVVAQKRVENSQDVGIAIKTLSGEQIEAFGFNESTDVVLQTPGVTVGGSIAGQFLTVNIRGVSQNDFADHVEAPNAVYVDDTYISFPQFQKFALFDTERVEILKGPQGTLFGRNATGGLVHYISRRPTDEFEASTKFTYGSYNQARGEGYISGPIGDGFKARASLLYNTHDDVHDNLIGEDEWNDDTIVGRGQLEYDNDQNLNVLLTFFGGRTITSAGPYQNRPLIAEFDADGTVINTYRVQPGETRAGIGPGGIDACPGCFFAGPRPTPGGDGFGYLDPDGEGLNVEKDFFDDDGTTYRIYSGTANISYDLSDSVTITSITDYKDMVKDNVLLDVDASPTNSLIFHADADSKQFSQELRIAGELDTFRWVLGGYYLDIDVFSEQGVGGPPTISGNNIFGAFDGVDYVNTVNMDTQSVSAFGQFEYDLSDQLTLIAGARVIWEDKDFTHSAAIFESLSTQNFRGAFIADLPNGGPPLLNDQDLSSSDTLWSGKAQLNWTPTDGLLVYAGANRGVKAGGFNQQLGGVFGITQFAYDPEILTAYEGGFKSDLFGNTRINAAVYYYDYDDYQAFRVNGLSFTVINADAEYYGAEVDIITNLFEGFDIGLSASYIDATVKDVPFASGPGGTQTTFRDREPTFTPDFQLSGIARYEWPVGPGLMALQGDFSYSSESYYNLTNFDGSVLDANVIGNARLSYVSEGDRWGIDVFVKNISDTRVDLVGFDFSTFCGCQQAGFGAPRWWGVSFKYNWGS